MKVEKFFGALAGTAIVLGIAYGCKGEVESGSPKFTVVPTYSGEIIRLNTVTGETCIVGESCDFDPFAAFVVGDRYIYKGNGKFEHFFFGAALGSWEKFLTVTGKDIVESSSPKFTVVPTYSGEIIRLNTVTGATCSVGKNCEADLFYAFVVGDRYIYKGNGNFEPLPWFQEKPPPAKTPPRSIKWEDLKDLK